jgi:hypothetical protein
VSIPRPSPELRREWAAKLAASGFVDAEDERGVLRSGGSHERRSVRKAQRSGRERYHRLAGQWEWLQVWKSRRHRLAWALHAEGWGVRTIERLLGTVRGASYRLLYLFIRGERGAMGRWLAEQPDEQPLSPFDEAVADYDYLHAERLTRRERTEST